MNSNARQAAILLTHYYRVLFEATGLRWDSDNQAELEALVAYLLEACVAEVQEHQHGADLAAAAKAPTHAALVDAGLLPDTALSIGYRSLSAEDLPEGPTAHTVWLAAQAAFRRLANDAVLERLATFDSGDYYTIQAAIEREAAALPGAPVQSQEVSPEAFSALLATQVADGSALPFSDGGEDL